MVTFALLSLGLCNLQNALPQILPLQHTQKPLDRVVYAIGDMINRLEAAVSNPLGDVLVALLSPARNVRVENDEALPA